MKDHMANLIKKLLRSNFVWQLSGLSYPTAVIATHGKYIKKDDYIIYGKNEMSLFSEYFNNSKNVLEFGCGPGKNLFGISDKIKNGYGIDINGFYIKIADKLKRRYGISNLYFIKYDGYNFPRIDNIDIVFSKGVFERIPKHLVEYYIGKLKEYYLKPNGMMILYFLMDRAKGTSFTKRLGDEAYVYWNDSEIRELLSRYSLKVENTLSLEFADFYIVKASVTEK
jgi:SAM-dependent methyltransferase